MKKELLVAVVASLLLGFGGGYAISQQLDDSTHEHEETSMGDGHSDAKDASHEHMMYMVDASQAPTVELEVEEDAKSGWNITLKTNKFTFTPDKVNQENVIGEGHAHLYVDGVKVARLYGNHFHYPESFDGTKTFRVTLNANDHSEYAIGEEVIAAEQNITHQH